MIYIQSTGFFVDVFLNVRDFDFLIKKEDGALSVWGVRSTETKTLSSEKPSFHKYYIEDCIEEYEVLKKMGTEVPKELSLDKFSFQEIARELRNTNPEYFL